MDQNIKAASIRRALLLTTFSSFLVPAAGVLTSPMLAQALGVEGRGELAAVLATPALAISVATLGLPEALTYYLAKYPHLTRRALAWSSALSALAGAVCLAATAIALPFLSAGDRELGRLIILATALAIPSLVIGPLRGAASGHQMWTAVAAERLVITVLRVGLFGALLFADQLTVLSAVLVISLVPIAASVVFWKVISVPAVKDIEPFEGNIGKSVTSFGVRMWLGGVASMLIARVAQILIAPLSNLYELGLYVVACTISDVPLIVALAVRDALYGINSRSNNARQIATTSRLTLLIGTAGCLVLGGSMPLWLDSIFGPDFRAAIAPTWILMLSAVLCIPGIMAAAGLSAWGRPGLRSIGLAFTLAANVPALTLLVPVLGANGAAWASLISNVVMTSFMIVAASRIMKLPITDFFLVRWKDVTYTYREATRLLHFRRGQAEKSESDEARSVGEDISPGQR